jgi:UPF0716 protein FxsA
MRFLFFVALVGLPVLDIATLIEVGRRMGAWPTVAMVVLSAVAGVVLVRAQGFAILTQARKTLNEGGFPAREAFDGACTLVGGALLILPGFASDILGLILLLPPFRLLLRRLIGWQVRRSGHFAIRTVGSTAPSREPGPPVLEGEYQTVEPDSSRNANSVDDKQRRLQSPWRQTDTANVVSPDET